MDLRVFANFSVCLHILNFRLNNNHINLLKLFIKILKG